jgi:hypothetical protein
MSVNMSFGFGVGDFIAVSNLIAKVVGCLKDVGGSKSEYQQLVSVLESPDRALSQLDRMKPVDGTASITFERIKGNALL